MTNTPTGARRRTTSRTGAIPQWTLTDRLAKARTHAGIDQDEMAREMGVSRQSISNWERGYAKPKRPYIWAWADVTGVDRHWLLWGEELPDDGSSTPDDVLPRLDSNQQPFGHFDEPGHAEVPASWLHEFRNMITPVNSANDRITP